MPRGKDSVFRIAHLSDLHCGGPYFVPTLLERALAEINELEPDIVVCSGDLTTFGFKQEFAQAKGYLDRIECESTRRRSPETTTRATSATSTSRRCSESATRWSAWTASPWSPSTRRSPISITARSGAAATGGSRSSSQTPSDLRIFVLHHHLLPVPGTGRERNMVYDAGDVIECLQRAGVNLVLSGHKHVPYAWRLENLFVINTGTVSSLRLRGNTRPCYNVVEIVDSHVDVWRKYPFHGQERDNPVLDRHARVREVHRAHRGRSHHSLNNAPPGVAIKAIAVIDGEHYPPVVRDALAELPYEFAAAFLAGGTEKLRGDADYGVPVLDDLEAALAEHRPAAVVDLSDEPVLGPRERLRLASRVLARGVRYVGPDFSLEPPPLEPFPLPSLAVIGTGKRMGKTAVAGYVARLLARGPAT